MVKGKYLVGGEVLLLAVLLLAVAGLGMGQGGVHRAEARDGAGFDGAWIVDFQAAMQTKVNQAGKLKLEIRKWEESHFGAQGWDV